MSETGAELKELKESLGASVPTQSDPIMAQLTQDACQRTRRAANVRFSNIPEGENDLQAVAEIVRPLNVRADSLRTSRVGQRRNAASDAKFQGFLATLSSAADAALVLKN